MRYIVPFAESMLKAEEKYDLADAVSPTKSSVNAQCIFASNLFGANSICFLKSSRAF